MCLFLRRWRNWRLKGVRFGRLASCVLYASFGGLATYFFFYTRFATALLGKMGDFGISVGYPVFNIFDEIERNIYINMHYLIHMYASEDSRTKI